MASRSGRPEACQSGYWLLGVATSERASFLRMCLETGDSRSDRHLWADIQSGLRVLLQEGLRVPADHLSWLMFSAVKWNGSPMALRALAVRAHCRPRGGLLP